jgi:hypothetical protein
MNLLRFFCFFGIHNWLPWQYESISEGYYDAEFWCQRKCSICGKIQLRDDT